MVSFQNLTVTFVITIISCVLATGSDMKDAGTDRGARSDRGPLWFGPRLGKRALRLTGENDRQAFFKLLEAADALKYYYDQLPVYETQVDSSETRKFLPKERRHNVIFTPKLGRSLSYDDQPFENVEFTPRLGRRLADDMPATPADQESYRPDPEQVDSRMKFFSPRLGRELAYENYPTKVRFARSANKTST